MEKKKTKKKQNEKQVKEVLKGTHTHVVIVVVAVVALMLSLICLFTKQTKPGTGENVSYRIYVGLTDKEANYQTVEKDAAKEIIKTICISNGFSYTIYEAEGAHKDNDNVLHTEKTVILEMDHINDKDLYKTLDAICERLNIQCVMVTKNPINVFYYYPDNKK